MGFFAWSVMQGVVGSLEGWCSRHVDGEIVVAW